jgi:hypothetical protein
MNDIKYLKTQSVVRDNTTRVAEARRDAALPPVISALHQSLVSAAFASGIYNILPERSRTHAGPRDDGEAAVLARGLCCTRCLYEDVNGSSEEKSDGRRPTNCLYSPDIAADATEPAGRMQQGS